MVSMCVCNIVEIERGKEQSEWKSCNLPPPPPFPSPFHISLPLSLTAREDAATVCVCVAWGPRLKVFNCAHCLRSPQARCGAAEAPGNGERERSRVRIMMATEGESSLASAADNHFLIVVVPSQGQDHLSRREESLVCQMGLLAWLSA